VGGSGARRLCTAVLLGLAATTSPGGCTTTTVNFVVTDGDTHDLPPDAGDATAVSVDGLDAAGDEGSDDGSFDGGGGDGLPADDAAGNDGGMPLGNFDAPVTEASSLDGL
jgi:hypothetical protein